MGKTKELRNKIVEIYKKHSVIYTLILIPIVIVVAYIICILIIFTLINYQGRHQYDARNEEIAKIIPFSQRGLPVPETDVPVILPPDPGEAGKQTLAGIDSNNDGVRDDLEREIVYMYPKNEEVRRVLRAMVKTGQDIIVTDGDHEWFKGLMISYLKFLSCHWHLATVDREIAYTNGDIISYMLKNTKERKTKFQINYEKALPFTGTSSTKACEEIKGQY